MGVVYHAQQLHPIRRDVAAQDQSLLGATLLGQSKFEAAEPFLLSGYAGMLRQKDTIPAVSRSDLAEARGRIVKLYQKWGKPEKVADWETRNAK